MAKKPAVVFIEIPVNFDTWELPDAVRKIIEPEIHSEPSVFYFPWPGAIPAKGDVICLGAMVGPCGDLEVDRIYYSYVPGKEVIIHIEVRPEREEPFPWTLNALQSAAEYGALFESHTPIKNVLRKAGLPIRHSTKK